MLQNISVLSQPLIYTLNDTSYCTNYYGMQQWAKCITEVEYLRAEVAAQNAIIQDKAVRYNIMLSQMEGYDERIAQAYASRDKYKEQRWWFAGGGAAVPVLVLLLVLL
jgi:hypothetical protein